MPCVVSDPCSSQMTTQSFRAGQRFDFHAFHIELDHHRKRCIDEPARNQAVQRNDRYGVRLVFGQPEGLQGFMPCARDPHKTGRLSTDRGVEPSETVAVQERVRAKPFRVFRRRFDGERGLPAERPAGRQHGPVTEVRPAVDEGVPEVCRAP